jgi:chitinase
LYGRWGEGYVGHPKYQFNIHETIQHYLSHGFPADKIVLGIHTENKGWILDDPKPEQSGIYCPGIKSPNMTYSRQEGRLYYYEILQLWRNGTASTVPGWEDVVLGRENWNIFDHENGQVDGCYLSPYMYQGKYWISYDDEGSVGVKARYANHYNLKGAFVWEVDTDNFMGMYGKEKFNILKSIRNAIESGKGLEPDEILGAANENQNCSPQAPFCAPTA